MNLNRDLRRIINIYDLMYEKSLGQKFRELSSEL